MRLFRGKEELPANTFMVVSARAEPTGKIRRPPIEMMVDGLLAPILSMRANILADVAGIGGTGKTTFAADNVRRWCVGNNINYIGFAIEPPRNAAAVEAVRDRMIERLKVTRETIEAKRRSTVVVIDDLDRLSGIGGIDWSHSVAPVQQMIEPLTQIPGTAVVVTRDGVEPPPWFKWDLRQRRQLKTVPPFTAEEIIQAVDDQPTGEAILGLSHGHPTTVMAMIEVARNLHDSQGKPEELSESLLWVLKQQNLANLQEMLFPWQQQALELVSPAPLFHESELRTAIEVGRLRIPEDEDRGLDQIGWNARDAGIAAWNISESKYRLDDNLRARLETHLKKTQPDIYQAIVSAIAGL